MSRPRIRSLKPEAWQDERIGALSRDARLLFVGLITMADDEGRLRAQPAMIIGHVYPWDEITLKQLAAWLAEIDAQRLVERYEIGGRPYIAFRNWKRHQRINRPTPSELPAPSGDVAAANSATDSVNDHGEASVISSAPLTPSRARGSDRDRKGKEEREREARELASSPLSEVFDVLRQSDRLHIDRVGVENAVGSWPGQDAVKAARTVITWVTDPAFNGTNAARLLDSALSKQQMAAKREAERPSFPSRRPAQQQASAEDFFKIARGEA